MSSGVVTVTGSLSIRERIWIGTGAIATAKLVDGEGEVLAATAWEVAGVPSDFTLSVDSSLVSERLFIWAMLRTEVGGWGTVELVPVSDDLTVVLTRVED